MLTPLAISGVVVLTGVSGVFVLLGFVLTYGSTRISVPEREEEARGLITPGHTCSRFARHLLSPDQWACAMRRAIAGFRSAFRE